MEETILQNAINVRYAKEANTGCCLSCGGAIDKADLKKGEVFLDLGSGRGMDVIRGARVVGSEGKAIGIDITKEMLFIAEENRKKLKIKNAEFIESPIDSIPLEDNSIDAVISNCTINHAKDKTKVYFEVFRVLKPGGRVIVSDVLAKEKLPDEIANDPQAVAACYGGAIPKEEYFSALKNAGFKEVEILEESAPYEKGGVTVLSLTIKCIKEFGGGS